MRNPITFISFVLSWSMLAVATCPDQELGKKCEDECEMAYVQCVNYCSNNSCLSECARVYQDCNNSCPCSDQCPNGCEDCPNPICVCGLNPSSQNLDNLNKCTGINSMELGECILDCNGGSKACDESCVDDFRTQQESCPCQEGCQSGCPCDNFECAPDKKSILVLNSWSQDGPVLIKNDGGEDRNLDFKMGERTSADKSCSAILNNEFYVFGGARGSIYERQISKINGCVLERIADLQTGFEYGACGTFKFPEERVVFCFGAENQQQECFSYNGETSMNLPSSNYWHQRTSLANIENKVMAVGSSGAENNNRAEVLDTQANIWTNRASFHFCSSRIFAYATVSRGDSVLLIGGACNGDDSSRIAKYTFDEWTEVGNLQTSRRAHRATADGNGRVFVVGGEGRFATEIWAEDVAAETVNIKQVQPILSNYYFYPELFTVASDFCTRN